MIDKRIAKSIRALEKVRKMLGEVALDLEGAGLGHTSEKVAQMMVDAMEAKQAVIVAEEAWSA